jgi:hypothetical protein
MTALAREARTAVVEKRFALWRAARERELAPEDNDSAD